MAGKSTITHMRKRRTGSWCSMGQGSGSTGKKTIPDGSGDEFDDAGESGDDLSPEDRLKKANAEAKKRRLQVRELRAENDRLKAALADGDDGGRSRSSDGPDPSELALALVEAGLSRSRIRMALKLVDLSSVEDVDDAIEDLKEEYPDLFTPERKDDDLPGQGSRQNGPRNRGGPLSQAELRRKYSALRPGQLW